MQVHNEHPGRDRLILVALGSNMPGPDDASPRENVVQALELMSRRLGPLSAQSALFGTPCFPPGAGPDYVNAAAALHCGLGAPDILAVLHAIEAVFGRERVQRWGQRTLDLDLVAAGDAVLPDNATHDEWRRLPLSRQVCATPTELILPHPRLQDRAFVLVPMAEVAPGWRHPVLGRTIAEMRDALPAGERAAIERLDTPG